MDLEKLGSDMPYQIEDFKKDGPATLDTLT